MFFEHPQKPFHLPVGKKATDLNDSKPAIIIIDQSEEGIYLTPFSFSFSLFNSPFYPDKNQVQAMISFFSFNQFSIVPVSVPRPFSGTQKQ
jgi:hypothetical protein